MVPAVAAAQIQAIQAVRTRLARVQHSSVLMLRYSCWRLLDS